MAKATCCVQPHRSLGIDYLLWFEGQQVSNSTTTTILHQLRFPGPQPGADLLTGEPGSDNTIFSPFNSPTWVMSKSDAQWRLTVEFTGLVYRLKD